MTTRGLCGTTRAASQPDRPALYLFRQNPLQRSRVDAAAAEDDADSAAGELIRSLGSA
jgi:hypothetical protein